MGTAASISILNTNGQAKHIEVLNDGYPQVTGAMLQTFYTDKKKIANIIKSGTLSSLGMNTGTSLSERNHLQKALSQYKEKGISNTKCLCNPFLILDENDAKQEAKKILTTGRALSDYDFVYMYLAINGLSIPWFKVDNGKITMYNDNEKAQDGIGSGWEYNYIFDVAKNKWFIRYGNNEQFIPLEEELKQKYGYDAKKFWSQQESQVEKARNMDKIVYDLVSQGRGQLKDNKASVVTPKIVSKPAPVNKQNNDHLGPPTSGQKKPTSVRSFNAWLKRQNAGCFKLQTMSDRKTGRKFLGVMQMCPDCVWRYNGKNFQTIEEAIVAFSHHTARMDWN